MREIKTCPFCGAEADTHEDTGMFRGYFLTIGCDTPKCHGNWHNGQMYDSVDDAIKAWNKRADVE